MFKDERLDAIRHRLRDAFKEAARPEVWRPTRSQRHQGNELDDAHLRLATPSDADAVVSWADETKLDASWLGAHKSPLCRAEVEGWIERSLVPVVVEPKAHPDILAFATIEALASAPPAIEVGRLVVAPPYRRRGIGSTLAAYLADRVVTAMEETARQPSPSSTASWSIVVRVHPDNSPAIQLLRQLPLFRAEPAPYLEGDTNHWYRFVLSGLLNEFGREIATRREALGMTQAMLAFLCGVQRPAINMIESGARQPSVSVLRRMVAVLGRDIGDRAAILLSLVGEGGQLHLPETLRIDQQEPDASLWILSDRLGEFIIPSLLQATRKAIGLGFKRWYFLPQGRWEATGELLVQSLRASDIPIERLKKQVRFFKAPEALCALRVEVRNPRIPSSLRVTIGGADMVRIRLDDSRAEAIANALHDVVGKLDTVPVDRNVIDGFSILNVWSKVDV